MLKWLMLIIYLLLISYLLWRVVHWFRRVHPLVNKKQLYIPLNIVFVLVCSTLLLGGLLPKSGIQRTLRQFSNYWLAFFIYFSFYTMCGDILVLLLKLIDRKKKMQTINRTLRYTVIGVLVLGLSIGCTVYGLIHADQFKLNSYETTIEKSAGEIEELNVVLLGDLHLGYSVGCEMVERVVTSVNELEPDIVVIAGDIFDNDFDALDDPERLEELFGSMKSKYGTYAVYGNHDVEELLIGGFPLGSGDNAYRDSRMVEFVEKCGFKMLEDDAVLIDHSFYLIGRVDEERDGNGTKIRESIEILTDGLDQTKPVMVLVHEPSELEETADAGVDMIMCGHTHAGQFFPLTIVQPIAWENYWGYLKVGNMDSFVTSGIGVYGPDVRVGTDSEIMQIRVRFEAES